ncbi:MAG TPA: hypothetical protein VGS10_15140 [Terracidiphilus sp.]|nr:hypothetical protein [Terracidiphilus sp.]
MAEINSQNRSPVVAGYFTSERNAEAALRELQTAGFAGNQIGIACHEEPAISVKKPEPGFWHRTQALFGGGANPTAIRTGAVQPLSTGQMAGPEATRPGLDAGDFHHTLTGLSLPDGRARHLSERFGRDSEGVLVTVDAGDRRGEAERIMRNHGADLGEEMESERLRRAS